MTTQSVVYRYPEFYALGYRWNTAVECDFIEAALNTFGLSHAKRLLDIGCGTGRHLTELARRGYAMTGIDLEPAMVEYVQAQSRADRSKITASIDDLRHLTVNGTYEAAWCLMDTFRFLLTNEEIVSHLRAVAEVLVPGGLYLTDFWVPRQLDQIGNEIHQWEQTEGDRTVRVFYLQHPETIDPVTQTFEDELVFQVLDGEQTQEIRGGSTRTRLILPQEFRALVELSGAFELVGTYGEFDLSKPLEPSSMDWRMVSVMRKRATATTPA